MYWTRSRTGFTIHHYDVWLREKVANLFDADLHNGSARWGVHHASERKRRGLRSPWEQ